MFGEYDKMTLSLVNAADTEGKLLSFSATLPVDDGYNIPEDLASVDVFEYQEGFISGGEIIFSIYVGEKSTLDGLVDRRDGKIICLREKIEIPSVESSVCYKTIGDKRYIYAVVEENDIVVSNHDELRGTISQLSSDYKCFSKAAQKIKNFGNNYINK